MKLMVGTVWPKELLIAISAASQIAPKTTWSDLDGNWLIANDCSLGSVVDRTHSSI